MTFDEPRRTATRRTTTHGALGVDPDAHGDARRRDAGATLRANGPACDVDAERASGWRRAARALCAGQLASIAVLVIGAAVACIDDEPTDAGAPGRDAGALVPDAGATLRANGSACDADGECASGRCGPKPGAAPECVAADCVNDEDCAPLKCATSGSYDGDGVCGATCAAPREAGQDCRYASDEGPCYEQRMPCADGLECAVIFNNGIFLQGSCVEPSTGPAACDVASDEETDGCADGYGCDHDAGACAPDPRR